MSTSGVDTTSKARRHLAEQARRLAAEGKWNDAAEINRQLIERAPKDVDAHNRLGKAYFEMRRYRSAYDAYQTAASLDPANVIAQRNISRIEPLKDTEEDEAARSTHGVRLGTFIEEVGKTYVDDLVNVAPPAVLTELSSGDRLTITVDGKAVVLVDVVGRNVGQLEPRLSKRMIELLELGNTYEAYVTSSTGQSVRVIIRETAKSAEMGSRLSFPRQGKVAIPRAYLRDTRLFRDEPEMLLGDDEDDDTDLEDPDEFDAAEAEEDDTEYVEEAGATADEDEETI